MHAVMGSGRLIAGRYRLEGPIGRGAMGIVWRGRDELLDRDVAVKEVQITALASATEAEAIYQRTLREARAAARLSHPAVVTVFDVVAENGSPWIVMELVSARSLDRVITEDGPLPPLQAAELGGSLVGALASAHAAGVLHRDVKPSNVLVTDDGIAVLTDFGIAALAGDPGITQAGMVVGTPGFTAPERVRGDVATPASDLWSLGATLYAAVEGHGPFDRAGGATAITVGVAKEDAPRSPSAGPLGPVIDALLSRDPSGRPDAATAASLLSEAAAAAATMADPAEQNGAFLGPPVFAELSMPELANPELADPASDGEMALACDATPGPLGSGQPTPDAAREFASAGPNTIAPEAAPVAEMAGLAALGLVGLDPDGVADFRAASIDGMIGADSKAAEATRETDHGDGGPVLWQPLRPAPGGPGSARPATGTARAGAGGSGGGASSGGSGASGPGGNDGGRFLPGAAARPRSIRWQLLLAGAGIAVIAAAAVVGWYLFGAPSTQALQNPTAPSITAPGGGAGAGHHIPGRSGPSGNHSGSAPAAGGSGPTTLSKAQPTGAGNPAATLSSRPGGSTGPSSSPSPSPSPSRSTSPTGPVLPPGYVWHRFTAAVMGTAAGFEIGVPASWQQSVTGQTAHLSQPADNFHLTANLASWTYAGPLAQAVYLEHKAAKTDQGYKELSLAAIGFRAVGGFRVAPGAELEFSLSSSSAIRVTELVILVTLTTKAGPQPYTFTLSAPSATFGSARRIFATAMPTFRPLPG